MHDHVPISRKKVNITRAPSAIIEFTRTFTNAAGKLEPGKVYPDYAAPIVRVTAAAS